MGLILEFHKIHRPTHGDLIQNRRLEGSQLFALLIDDLGLERNGGNDSFGHFHEIAVRVRIKILQGSRHVDVLASLRGVRPIFRA